MSEGKVTARMSGDILTLVVAVALMLVGGSVIAGWHLHVRALVRVVPNTIPMQYNTALCFIALGASAFLQVSGRGHRILSILAALFVILMGTLVAVEYAAGIKIGIDTAFFYPWDQTLSADPGRMALTSAISFTSAGGALLLLALRPRSVAVFAAAHTLPLSLGLTSTLGYVAGVTYVLPFHLGSQMAIHTALSFLAYGGVMLTHAWRLAPPKDDGIPGWSPALAVAMVPVLFVGASVTTQGDSLSTWGLTLFIGLVVAGMFGLAAYKLTQSRIALKGFILISVPLAFVLAFVLLVLEVKRQNEEAQARHLHSKEVIAQTEFISRSLADAEASIRGYVITGDPSFTATYRRAALDIPEGIRRLQTLVHDNPAQEGQAARIGARAAGKMAFLARIERLVLDAKNAQAVEEIKSGRGQGLTDDFQRELESFLEAEQRLDVARREMVESSQQRFNWLLVAGASIDILLTLMLAVLFTHGISRRVRVLTENARSLAEGKELTETMRGTDEIAHLDQVFHEMANALTEASRKGGARRQELETMAANLTSANKELEAFSYSVSHDLRAPLRAVDGFSRILLEDYADKLDDEGRRVLGVIRQNTQNMGRLIDDLLAFSRFGRKQIEPSMIDVGELAKDVFAQLDTNSDKRPQLEIKQPPVAYGDRALMRQVFVNLLSNAAKYSRPTGMPLIEVGGLERDRENVYYVKDNGAGFDMKYVKKLFGVFQRLHSHEEFEGTGVGLAIVRRIVERHGGRVWAEGKTGEGATFYFTLPKNGENHNGHVA